MNERRQQRSYMLEYDRTKKNSVKKIHKNHFATEIIIARMKYSREREIARDRRRRRFNIISFSHFQNDSSFIKNMENLKTPVIKKKLCRYWIETGFPKKIILP